MKLFTVSIALVATIVIPFTLAQSLADLPTCAQQPAIAAIEDTGCGLTDIACVCKNVVFIQALQNTVAKLCSGTQQTGTYLLNTILGLAADHGSTLGEDSY